MSDIQMKSRTVIEQNEQTMEDKQDVCNKCEETAKEHFVEGVGASESLSEGSAEAEAATTTSGGHNQAMGEVSIQAHNVGEEEGIMEVGKFVKRGGRKRRRHRGRMRKQHKQQLQKNPIWAMFSKRQKLDKGQLNTGHLIFEEKELPLLEYTDYLQAQMEVEAHFNKKFSFSKPPEGVEEPWKLPAAETMYTKKVWQDEDLQESMLSLNKVKCMLRDKDIALWHAHTKFTNPAERIAYTLKRFVCPEMVTQAWLKFFEIASNYPIVPPNEELEKSSEDEIKNIKYDGPELEKRSEDEIKNIKDDGPELEKSSEDEIKNIKDNGPELEKSSEDEIKNINDDGPELEKSSEEDDGPFHSVHLCEAPGAFIVALNHFLSIHRPSLKWQWLGNTLNPYYEGTPSEVCVVEDKLIYHTLHNWTFGQNNTGDLMEKDNLDDIIHRAEYMGPIHLVTADGSFDCQASPGDQEKTTHNLHLCEVVTALSILAPGGSFVIKKFTMFESETINVMYLFCCVFKEVHVFKPGSSKEGNSEVYVICLDYRGKKICEPHLSKLIEVYGTFGGGSAMFNSEDIPSDFLLQMRKCTEIFKAYQIKTIMKNIAQFEKMTEKDIQYNELLKCKASGMYFQQSYCEPISKELTLTGNKVNKTRYLLENDMNKPISSTFVRTKCQIELLSLAKKCLNSYIEEYTRRRWIIEISKGEHCNVSRLATLDLDDIDIDVVRGKPYTKLKSSKFCSQKIQECIKVLCNIWDGCEGTPAAVSLDDSVLKFVVNEHPEAKVLRAIERPNTTNDLGAMMEALVKIKEKVLSKDDSLILFNATVFSRLQCGLLHLLGSAFENITIYTSPNIGENAPVIVLENFKSLEHGEALVTAVHKTGWNPFDDDPAISAKVLQLVSYPVLVENIRLCTVHYYNLHHTIHRSLRLINILETKLSHNSLNTECSCDLKS